VGASDLHSTALVLDDERRGLASERSLTSPEGRRLGRLLKRWLRPGVKRFNAAYLRQTDKIRDYEQERDGVITFSGHGVFTFEPEAEVYSLHWFDCMGSPPEVFTGSFDGDILTMAHGGPGMHARITHDLTDPQTMLLRMEMSADGVAWDTLFDGRYERI
jgi:hypothetical protein